MNEFGGLCPVQESGRTAFVRFDAYKPEMFRRGQREMLNRTPGSSSASAVHFAPVAGTLSLPPTAVGGEF